MEDRCMSEIIIEIYDTAILTRKRKLALDGFELFNRKGSLSSIIGENGAGKVR